MGEGLIYGWHSDTNSIILIQVDPDGTLLVATE